MPPHPPLTPTTGRKPSDTSTSPSAAIYLPSEWPPPSLSSVLSLRRPRAFAIIKLPYHLRKIIIGPQRSQKPSHTTRYITRYRRGVYSTISGLRHPPISSLAILDLVESSTSISAAIFASKMPNVLTISAIAMIPTQDNNNSLYNNQS